MARERKFIRHASAIKIDYEIEKIVAKDGEHLKDISYGGISFYSRVFIKKNKIIKIKIPITSPAYEFEGKVVRCSKLKNKRFLIAVEFFDSIDAFKTRMIEQICYIEEYKQKKFRNEGIILSSEEAAMEWIEKYAANFPKY